MFELIKANKRRSALLIFCFVLLLSLVGAAFGVLPEGLIRPADFVLSERRLILGVSDAGLAKLNSPGSAPGSGCVAGI